VASRSRLSAAERRASLLDCACSVFSRGSYRGTTTAELAAQAGVTEPVLYQHFASKRALYLACMEETWSRIRSLWDEVVTAEPDPGRWVAEMGRAFLESAEHRPVVSNLWLQALAEGTGDAEIAAYMRTHIREVHDYVADVMRRAQAAGAIPEDRDCNAEAWIFLSLGLLSMADRRVLGGLMDADWDKIREARLRWLTGA
jgi:TetR/AcrR family transcriptional regulator